MKHLQTIIFLFSLGSIFNISCHNRYDEKLQTPDIDANGIKHGYNLTELGSMVYAPWQYDLRPTNDSLYNIRVVLKGEEVYSTGIKYLKEEADLVFLLQKDMTLKYWFKKDYLHPTTDTTEDGAIIKHGVSIDDTNIKNIYIGQWTMNTNDSTFQFQFTDNKMPLSTIEGKYLDLGSTTMSFQNTFTFDSTINGKNLTLKKIITKYFTH